MENLRKRVYKRLIQEEETMNVLLFAGSLRKDSCNKKFAREAMRLLKENKLATPEFQDLKGLDIPPYDGDIEESGIPKDVTMLGEKIAKVDALIISTPEYNGGISGVLKNAADWISRIKPIPLGGKHLLLLGASPGALGSVRGLWHSRVPFEVLGMHVYPQMMGLPNAYEAFGEDGKLKDEKPLKQLTKLLEQFTAHVAR